MSARVSMIRELEHSIRNGSPNQRITTLRRVTDLFIKGADRFDEEQIKLFDDVIVRLAAQIEKAALAELANRLAPVGNAPKEAIRMLARDETIAVAGPVLSQSQRLDEGDLLEIARTGSQAHLLAISGRAQVGEALTDILVERGNWAVTRKIASNGGARFSELSFANLVARAERDDLLAETVGRRLDVPPYLFHKLVTQATARVQQRLLAAAKPEMKLAIQHLLAEISEKVRANPESASRSYSAARSFVQVLVQQQRLTLGELVDFAKSGRFEETVVALAELSSAPVDIVDRVMHGDCVDPFLVLCKAKGFDWPIVRALLLVRRECRTFSSQELSGICDDYNALSQSTADRVLRFWQIRQGEH